MAQRNRQSDVDFGAGSILTKSSARKPQFRLLVAAGFCPAILLIVNLLLIAKLFHIEYSTYLLSIEGTFITIARWVAAHPGQLGWWPLWDCGLPFQNTYLPLLHLITGTFSGITGRSPALAFHQVSAAFFAIGPVSVYFMALVMTQQIGASFFGALAYSLLSPCAWIIPAIREDLHSGWNLRRLQILVYYGEGPHTACLAFLPLAILFLYLAIVQRRTWHKVAAGLFLGAAVLTNAFAAVILVIAGVSLLATVETRRLWRNILVLAIIGALAYAFISPLMPPSVIRAIRFNSPITDGHPFTLRSLAGVAVLAAGFAILWWITRRVKAPAWRFFVLFAFLNSGIVWLAMEMDIYVVPQPHRYSTAMDMGISLAVVFGIAMLLRNWTPRAVAPVAVVAFIAAIPLARHDMRYARHLIQGIDITTTPTYSVARWMDRHLDNERVMVPGSYSFYFNNFTNTPQLQGGHEPMQPSFEVLIAVFAIYSGMNAGRHDAQYSILWLKAFGAHAIAVSGPGSSEYYKPFPHPRKFDGVLPVLWREGDDTIYAVPSRSDSLAHIVPANAVVHDPPINGLDVHEIEGFVKALDDPSLPEASFVWRDHNTANIQAPVQPGQAVSVQVTYTPGWKATVDGVPQDIKKDGLGLIEIQPTCRGECQIVLHYDGGPEWRWTCLASLLAVLTVAGYFIWTRLAQRSPSE